MLAPPGLSLRRGRRAVAHFRWRTPRHSVKRSPPGSMPNDPSKASKEIRPDWAAAELGFTRSPSENDPRRDPKLLEAIEKVAPGTQLRVAVDDVIRSHEGALIVVGDPQELAFLYSGGIRLDAP